MGKNLITEEIQLNITINGNSAKRKLGELEMEANKLRSEMKGLKKDSQEYIAKNAELVGVQKKMGELRNEIGLTGLTMKQLNLEAKKLRLIRDNLTYGTEGWKKADADLQKVTARMTEVKNGSDKTGFSLGKLADGFNRYTSLFIGATAVISGVVFSIKNLIDGNAQLSDSFADVAKTTGLSIDQVKDLNKELRSLNTRTSQKELLDLARIAGKLGIEGKENIKGFVKAADQINIALSEDLGGNTEEAINQVGKLVDIFKIKQKYGIEEGMLKVGSAINSLGAASTASEEYLVEFSKRVGGIAPNVNMSIQDVLGLAATLDQLGQTSEVSSTVLGQLFVKIGKDAPYYAKLAGMSLEDFRKLLADDVNGAFIKVLEGAKNTTGGLEGMAKSLEDMGVDGQRSVSVVGVLTNNIDLLKQQQKLSNDEFEKGTSLTKEFNVKNENLAANLEKIGKTIAGAFVNSQFSSWLGDVVAKVAEWTKTNLSDEIDKERQEFMRLMTALKYTNEEGEFRNKLIKEIQDKYSSYLGNLDLEKASFNDIEKSIVAVNKQLMLKAALADKDMELEELGKDIGEAINDNYETREELLDRISKSGAKNIENEKINIQYLRSRKAAEKQLNDVLNEQAGYRGSDMTGLAQGLDKKIYEYKKLISDLDNFYSKYYEGNKEIEDLSKKQQELLNAKAGITSLYDESTKGGKGGDDGKGGKGGDDGKGGKGGDDGTVNLTNKEEEDLKKKLDAQKEYREKAILESKSLIEQENAAYEERLKDAGIFGKNQEDLKVKYSEAYQALEKDHNDKIAKINKDADEQVLKDKKDAEEQALKDKQDAFDKVVELLDTANQEEENLLMQQRLDGKLTQEQYNSELEILELAHLEAIKSARLQAGYDVIDIETQILNKKLALFNTEKKESKELSDAIVKDREAQVKASVQAGFAAVENAKTFEEATRNVLNSIRSQIKAYIAEAVAASVAKTVATIPFPINIIVGTAAAAGVSALFDAVIPQFAKGQYPVIGEDDGKTYNANFGGKATTGMVNKPTLFLAGEEPEMIIDGPTLKNPLVANYARAIQAIKFGSMPQFAEGNYPIIKTKSDNSLNMQLTQEIAKFHETNKEISSVLKELQNKGVKGVWEWDYDRDSRQMIQDIENDVNIS